MQPHLSLVFITFIKFLFECIFVIQQKVFPNITNITRANSLALKKKKEKKHRGYESPSDRATGLVVDRCDVAVVSEVRHATREIYGQFNPTQLGNTLNIPWR